jgi:hypothetical protein
LRLCAVIDWLLRAAIRCGRACEVATDFFCGAPNAGAASAAAAARQLIQTNRFVFTLISSLLLIRVTSSYAQMAFGFCYN